MQLMLLGLRDADAMACVTHGVKRNSKSSPSQPNPVDAVFRMAADMSGCRRLSHFLSVSAAAASRAAAAPTPSISFNSRVAAALRVCAAGMRMSSAPTRLLLLLLLVLVVALLRRRFENIARALRLLWRYNRR